MRTNKTTPEMCATREMLLPSFHGINRVSLVNYSNTKKEANDLPSALIFGRHVNLFNVQGNVFISRCFCRYQVLLSWKKYLVNLHVTFDQALLLQTAHTTILGPLMLLKAEHNVGRPIACYIRKHTNVTPVAAIIFLLGSWTVVLQNQLHKWCQDNKSYGQPSKADHMDTTRMTATPTSRTRVVARSISVLQIGCVEV